MFSFWRSLLVVAMIPGPHIIFGQTPDWQEFAQLPNPLGVAGPFAGVHGGALLVGGGANFPDAPPWAGGTKTWFDTVYVLQKAEGEWEVAGQLPRPLGYGVSLSTPEGILCLGGSDSQRHYAECFRMSWSEGALQLHPLPVLPRPCANFCGAILGSTVYVCGGTLSPTETAAFNSLWSLDLAAEQPQWQELKPCPGPGRMLAVAAVLDGAFYVCSGAALKPGPEGKPVREYLRDAYCYRPLAGWQRISDLPEPAVAAPSPSPAGSSRMLILGGDTGAHAGFQPLDHHPGFSKTMYAFDRHTMNWSVAGQLPVGHVTTNVVDWNGMWVIPSGEIRPGVRSPQVWGMQHSVAD